MHHQGVLTFVFDDNPLPWEVHVFNVSAFEPAEPTESDEMAPVWFDCEEIPLHKMWADDEHW